MQPDRLMGAVVAAIVGAVVGSFLNVLIYRVPRRESIAFPGSHCPWCGAPIRWWDNIPVLSYLVLHGKCRRCAGSISPRYPAVEILAAVLALWLFLLDGPTMRFAAETFLAWLLIVAAAIDLDHMIIPDRITYPGMMAAAVFAVIRGPSMMVRGVTGALVGLALLGAMYLLGRVAFKREGVGMGDFKLIVVMGLILGPLWMAGALWCAVVAGGLWGMAAMALGAGARGREVPFGPFLALGGWSVLVFRSELAAAVRWYLERFM